MKIKLMVCPIHYSLFIGIAYFFFPEWEHKKVKNSDPMRFSAMGIFLIFFFYGLK